jgi:hypothetical protein
VEIAHTLGLRGKGCKQSHTEDLSLTTNKVAGFSHSSCSFELPLCKPIAFGMHTMPLFCRALFVPLFLAVTVLAGCGDSGSSSMLPATAAKAGTTLIANGDNAVSSCITTSTGLLSECRFVVPDATLVSLSGIALSGNRLYLLDLEKKLVDVCTLSDDGVPGTCSPTDVSGLLTMPVGMAASNTNVYIGNGSNSVVACSLDANGQLTNCANQGDSKTFSYPSSISLWKDHAYVLNSGNGTVSRCSFGVTGSFASCTTISLDGLPTNPSLSSLTIANGHAYITDGTTPAVYSCALVSDGGLAACQTTSLDAGMSGLGGLVVNGSRLYIAGVMGDAVGVCTLATSGAIASCETASGPGILSPIAFAFKPAA